MVKLSEGDICAADDSETSFAESAEFEAACAIGETECMALKAITPKMTAQQPKAMRKAQNPLCLLKKELCFFLFLPLFIGCPPDCHL
jgi:hypothetical protein